MNILLLGSGGRENALAWKIAQSPRVENLYIAPGNAGTARIGRNIALSATDFPALKEFAIGHDIDMVVVGPEDPLVKGVYDYFKNDDKLKRIPVIGPSASGARLEGSKDFAKAFMMRHHIPTARYESFTAETIDQAYTFLESLEAPYVLKADGLAAGKGVLILPTLEEAKAELKEMLSGMFGEASRTVVIEEFLVGEEVSLLAFCDGKTALPLPSAQDHKAVFDGDTGPNTGGMGAYSPAPIVPDAELEKMADIAIRPILAEMARQGHPFTGILYAGLMMTKDGPKVLEYNVRFGDPECEPLLMRLESDLLEIMDACIDGRLDEVKLSIRPESALGVVIAAEGYPGSYPKGMEIKGIDAVDALPDTKVFQAGTKREGSRTLSSGGRVLCVTALGKGLAEAQKRAYEAVAKIDMEKSQHRSDIGAKGLRRL